MVYGRNESLQAIESNDGPAFELRGVSKTFGATVALRAIDLTVDRGQTVGFVGLNGAGKSTTMRILLGLARPTSGIVNALGVRVVVGQSRVATIGALIERPSLHPHLSVYDNLELFGTMRGAPRPTLMRDISALLRDVDLDHVGRKRLSQFSTGMRQRVGVAAAFLGDPELVVLDEPTDGLDPEGVVALRELIRARARAGVTLFVSSHMLGEVETVADRVVGIHAGEIVMDVSPRALGGYAEYHVRFDTIEEASRAASHLDALGFLTTRTGESSPDLIVQCDKGSLISKSLAGIGTYPAALVELKPSLETTFLRIARQLPKEAPSA